MDTGGQPGAGWMRFQSSSGQGMMTRSKDLDSGGPLADEEVNL